jgi:Dolichyl-phosphate-mannose-protein mannosyltransferase
MHISVNHSRNTHQPIARTAIMRSTLSSRECRLALLGVVLLTFATRLPCLLHPQPLDNEAVYSVVANEIVDGGRPYADAIERKPPLLFWTYAAIFKAFGKYNWKALHAVGLVWVLATMAGLYAIGKELFDRNAGLIAALLYSVYQPWVSWKDLAFHAEVLMNLPIVLAWAIAFQKSSARVRPELLAAGALLCAAFLLKQPAAIAAVPLGIYLLLSDYRVSRHLTGAAAIGQAATLTVGFFGTLGLVIIVLQKQHILAEAFHWTITDHTIPHVFVTHGLWTALGFIIYCLPLILGVVMAYRDTSGIWKGVSAERTALLGLLAASVVGVAAGARFYQHYYIQLFPPLALVAAPHYSSILSNKTEPPPRLLRPWIVCVWLGVTVVWFSIVHWWGLASRREPSEAGRYLREHSAPDDRIFVWGDEAKIYLDAQRRPASRYVMTFPLTGRIWGADLKLDTRSRIQPGSWNTLEQDFRRHPPAFIVDTESYPDAHYPVADFPILAKWIAEDYQPVFRTAEAVIYRIR